MFFRSPLPSLGLLKTVTLVLAILLPMSWPCFVTYVLASDPPERPESLTKEIKRVAAPASATSNRLPSRTHDTAITSVWNGASGARLGARFSIPNERATARQVSLFKHLGLSGGSEAKT